MDTKIDQLKQIIPEKYILRQEPMKNHTTFRIGGPADIFVAPENMEEIKAVSRFAKEEGIPLFVLGNGSNLLVADDGMDGIVLQIYKNYSGIEVRGNELIVKAGTLLSSTSRAALNEELTGFEFAGGIPGTFGGAVVMNAGAYGGEMVQVLKEVTVLTKEGEIKTLKAEELELGYRTSNVLKNEYVVLEGVIALKKGNKEEIKDAGYVCVDNLPVALLDKFADMLLDETAKIENVALGIDIRNGRGIGELAHKLKEIEAAGIKYEILYLNASNRILLKRYKETRRNHPLSRDGRVEDGIAKEREIMKFLQDQATYVIDTSQLLTRELKEEIDRIFVDGEEGERFQIAVVSFGFKHGIPADVDLVFDVRFLPNPYYDLNLRPLTGNDKPIQDFVMKHEESVEFLDKLDDMMRFLIPNYIKEGKYNLVIGIGCTGGKHRSVTITNKLAERLKQLPYSVKVEHRDIMR